MSTRARSSKKLTVQLIPRNDKVKGFVLNSQCKPHLQLVVSGKKKVASILAHLNKKWNQQKAYQGFRLYLGATMDLSWGEENTHLTIFDIFRELDCDQSQVLQLYYDVTSNQIDTQHYAQPNPLSPPNLSDFYLADTVPDGSNTNILVIDDVTNDVGSTIEPFNCNNLFDSPKANTPPSTTQQIESPPLKHLSSDIKQALQNLVPEIKPDDIDPDLYFLVDKLPNPVSLSPVNNNARQQLSTTFELLQQSLPQTPIKSVNLFGDSNDGFSATKNTSQYVDRSRDFWFDSERSVDFCSFYTKSKRPLNTAPKRVNPPAKRRLVEKNS